jgi:hypothetical protein
MILTKYIGDIYISLSDFFENALLDTQIVMWVNLNLHKKGLEVGNCHWNFEP